MAAVEITNLTSGNSTTNGAATASISPSTGAMLLLTVVVTDPSSMQSGTALTPSGVAATWTQHVLPVQDYASRRRVFLFRGTGTMTPGTVTLTFDMAGGTYQSHAWSIEKVNNWDGTTPVANVESFAPSAASSYSGILGDTPATDDAGFSIFAVESGSADPVHEAAYTQLSKQTGLGNARALAVAYDNSDPIDATPEASWGVSSNFLHATAIIKTGANAESGGSDTTPDAFSFTDQTGIALSTQVESNTITVAGIDAAAAISITGGGAEYRINAGAYTTAAGTVNNGDTVQLRMTSSATGGTVVSTTLDIGGVTDVWTVTTEAVLVVETDTAFPVGWVKSKAVGLAETTDTAFAVAAETVVVVGQAVETDAPLTAVVAKARAVALTTETDSALAAAFVKSKTASLSSTTDTALAVAVAKALAVGLAVETDSTFGVTAVGDTTPDAFSFTDITDAEIGRQYVSNSISPVGFSEAAAISITGGEYSIDAGAYTSSPGTISPGSSVTVRHTTPKTYGTTTNTVLTIGGVSDTYTTTTRELEAGWDFIDVTSVHSPSSERLSASPDDIEIGDRIEWGDIVGSGTVVVNADCTFDAASGVTSFAFRVWDDATDTLGSEAIQSLFTVGLATETDTAFAVGVLKTKAAGLAAETDSAFAVAAAKGQAAGLVTETDSALAVGKAKVKLLGLTTETDSAFAVEAPQAVTVGQAEETDTALQVTVVTSGTIVVPVELAEETDTAFPIVATKALAIGLAEETGTALAVDPSKAEVVGLVTETDSAPAIAGVSKDVAVGLAEEADVAFRLENSGASGGGGFVGRMRRRLGRGLLSLRGR